MKIALALFAAALLSACGAVVIPDSAEPRYITDGPSLVTMTGPNESFTCMTRIKLEVKQVDRYGRVAGGVGRETESIRQFSCTDENEQQRTWGDDWPFRVEEFETK